MLDTVQTRWKNFIQLFIKDLEYLESQDPKGCKAYVNNDCVGCPVHEAVNPMMNIILGTGTYACELFLDPEEE